MAGQSVPPNVTAIEGRHFQEAMLPRRLALMLRGLVKGIFRLVRNTSVLQPCVATNRAAERLPHTQTKDAGLHISSCTAGLETERVTVRPASWTVKSHMISDSQVHHGVRLRCLENSYSRIQCVEFVGGEEAHTGYDLGDRAFLKCCQNCGKAANLMRATTPVFDPSHRAFYCSSNCFWSETLDVSKSGRRGKQKRGIKANRRRVRPVLPIDEITPGPFSAKYIATQESVEDESISLCEYVFTLNMDV